MELKFRFWDLLDREMHGNDYPWGVPYNEVFIHTPDQRPYEIMQFTGLKDKNGKEIYKDDILSDGQIRFRVFQVPGGFVIRDSVWRPDTSDMTESDMLIVLQLSNLQNKTYIEESCEVIGNIHQNKDFLL